MQMRQDCSIHKCPGKAWLRKGENVKVEKLSKERLSVLFCCSATGKKLKPLVTGNVAHSRIFRGHRIDTKHLPVDWRSNKKAWMTQAIFEEWLVDVNNLMRKQNRKILTMPRVTVVPKR
jgi:hypothetical protein